MGIVDGRFAAVTPQPFFFPGFRRRRFPAYRYNYYTGGFSTIDLYSSAALGGIGTFGGGTGIFIG